MKVDRNTPLHPEDSMIQTQGCRRSSPQVCRDMDMSSVCAFVRNDGLCLKPPNSWATQYKTLVSQE